MVRPEDVRSAQFIDTYFPIIDGVVQTVHNYALLMNEQTYSCVVCPKPRESYEDADLPYDIFRTEAIKIPFWEYSVPAPAITARLKKNLAQKELSILHLHSPFFTGSYAASLGKSLGLPVVATFHSKYYDDALRLTKSKSIADMVVRRIVRLYEHCDSVWACSEGTAQTLHEYGYRGDIFVMTNGTNFEPPRNPEKLAAAAAKEFGLPAGKKLLLFVGHQIWQKNLKLVLDTFRLLCDADGDYRLVIVGNGYNEDAIREYAKSLGFPQGAVRFTGRIVDRDLLSGVFLNAGLFFFPSVYDNAPLVVREAAAMGVPSLLTRGSNAAESVVEGKSGFLAAESAAEMAAEITRVFAEPGLLERVGQTAKETIPIPWREIIPRVREKYAQVIADKK